MPGLCEWLVSKAKYPAEFAASFGRRIQSLSRMHGPAQPIRLAGRGYPEALGADAAAISSDEGVYVTQEGADLFACGGGEYNNPIGLFGWSLDFHSAPTG
jgi:hypothetical protein